MSHFFLGEIFILMFHHAHLVRRRTMYNKLAVGELMMNAMAEPQYSIICLSLIEVEQCFHRVPLQDVLVIYNDIDSWNLCFT